MSESPDVNLATEHSRKKAHTGNLISTPPVIPSTGIEQYSPSPLLSKCAGVEP